MRILLVDDEPVLRSSIAILLRRMEPSLEIQECSDGLAALDEMERIHYDVVISDIRMPDMDGIALTQTINERWADVQVVLLTGYASFEYAREALRCGATDYLLKPIRYGDLQGMMERIKKRSTQISETERPACGRDDVESIIQKACDYIRSHYSENLTLRKMSDRFYLNASYFSDQFARIKGKGFVEYLTDVRMKKARLLLAEQRTRSVTDIALEVGYADSRYFSHVFKKYHDMTPSEYRKRIFEN